MDSPMNVIGATNNQRFSNNTQSYHNEHNYAHDTPYNNNFNNPDLFEYEESTSAAASITNRVKGLIQE